MRIFGLRLEISGKVLDNRKRQQTLMVPRLSRSRGRTRHASHPRLGETALRRDDPPRHAARRRAGAGGAVAAAGAARCRRHRLRRQRPRPRSFGKAKSIILIHLYGSPSQLEWVDCKPDAPAEIRGEFGVIPSSLPGCNVVRAVSEHGEGDGPHDGPPLADASVSDSRRGLRPDRRAGDRRGDGARAARFEALAVISARWWSIVECAGGAPALPGRRSCPPFPATSPCRSASARSAIGEVPRAGPYAAFLGSQYDPLWADFVGTATKGITKTLRDMTYTDHDPYVGVEPTARTSSCPMRRSLQPELTLDRLDTAEVAARAAQSGSARPGRSRRRAGRCRSISSRRCRCSNRRSCPRRSTCASEAD